MTLLPAGVRAQGDQGTPADAAVSESTGAATLSIPIDTPRGTGGFQPALALRYTSLADDGPFGVGWGLQLGEIRRATRFGTPSYVDSADRFELDGELLVPSASEPGRFHTQTESFRRIVFSASGWEVTFPNGNRARFGWDQQSRVRRGGSTGPQTDDGPIFRWLLTQLEDVNGNTIRFVYEREVDPGTAYPKRIEYTYRGGVLAGPRRRIEFILGERPDVLHHFSGGVEAVVTRRVIEVRSSVSNQTFRRLRLYYDDGPYTTGRTRLTSSRLFGSDCPLTATEPETACVSSMPLQTYTYTDAADVVPAGTSTHWQPDPSTTPVAFDGQNSQSTGHPNGVQIGDVNGDGWSDLVQAILDGSNLQQRVFLGGPNGWSSTPDPHWTSALRSLRFTAVQPRVALITGKIDCGTAQVIEDNRVIFSRNPSASPYEAQLVDIDGDGLADIVMFGRIVRCDTQPISHGARMVWRNTGNGWEEYSTHRFLPAPLNIASYRSDPSSEIPGVTPGSSGNRLYSYRLGTAFVDLNGDGRLDLLAHSVGPYSGPSGMSSYVPPSGAWFNTEGGWISAPEYELPHPMTVGTWKSGNLGHYLGDTAMRFVDLNGDGLTDVLKGPVTLTSGVTSSVQFAMHFSAQGVWLNTGSGWCSDEPAPGGCEAAQRYRLPAGTTFSRVKGSVGRVIDAGLILLDLNGDGLIDLIRADGTDEGGFGAWIHDPASGSVWQNRPEFEPPPTMALIVDGSQSNAEYVFRRGVRVFDVDSNGTPDFVQNLDGNTQAQFRSRAAIADRLSTHSNGLGGGVSFAYDNMPRMWDDVREADVQQDASLLGEANVGSRRWSSSSVVVSMEVDPGEPGQQHVYSFRYGGPRWCQELRSGLGFRLVDKFQPDGGLVRSFFYQAHGRAGQVSQRSVWEGGAKLWQADSAWETSVVQDHADHALRVYSGHLAGETERTFHGTATGAVRTTSYHLHPSYGFNFVSRIEIRRPTGNLDIERTPRPVDATRWIAGLVESETQEWGGVVYASATFGYDDLGRLTEERRDIQDRELTPGQTEQAITRWTYDVHGNVKTRMDPESRIERFCHDGDSSVDGYVCPIGGSGARAVLSGVQDKLGEWTAVISDPATGDIRSLLRFNGDFVTVEVDAFGRPKRSLIQPAGSSIPLVLERRNYFDGTDNPSGQPYVETLRYAAAGEAGGVRTATYLDGLGRVAREVRPSETGWFGAAYRRDHAGRVVRETLDVDCGGDSHCGGVTGDEPPARIVAFDALGRPSAEQTPLGVRAFRYETAEREGATYDAVLIKKPRGSLVRRLFEQDRVAWVEECDNTVSAGATDPGSSCTTPAVTRYEYEPTGELRRVRDALGFPFEYTYDSLGRARTIQDPNAGVTTLEYTAAGSLWRSTNGRGQSTEYDYDPLDRVTQVLPASGEQPITIDYDPSSRAPSLIVEGPPANPTQTLSIEYDPLGREERRALTVAQRTLVADFRYDLLDRIEEVVYPNGWSALYTYQGAYFESVCGKAPGAAGCLSTDYFIRSTVHDGLGRVAQTALSTMMVTRSYDPQHHLPRTLHVDLSGTRLLDLEFASYDEAGNIRRIEDRRPGAQADGIDATATYDYYPNRDWLRSHDLGGTTSYFAYDVLGNLTGRSVGSPAQQNQFLRAGYPHRLESFTRGGSAFAVAYDGDGNVVQRGSQHFWYDARNRLRCVGTAPSGAGTCATALYLYDPLGDARTYEYTTAGERLYLGDLFEWDKGTSRSTMHIVVDGRRVASVERASDTLRTASLPPFWQPPLPWWTLRWAALGLLSFALLGFAWRLEVPAQAARRPVPVAVSLALVLALVPGQVAWGSPPPPGSGVVKRWFVEDHAGSAALVLDGNGNVVERRVFEPFGKVFAQTGTITAPRFTGKRSVPAAETPGLGSLYDFGARWYDAELGRFQQIDPIVQSPFHPVTLNAYAYAGNDPVNQVDPDGRGFWKKFLGVVQGFAPIAMVVAAPFLAGAVGALGTAVGAGAEAGLAAAAGAVAFSGAGTGVSVWQTSAGQATQTKEMCIQTATGGAFGDCGTGVQSSQGGQPGQPAADPCAGGACGAHGIGLIDIPFILVGGAIGKYVLGPLAGRVSGLLGRAVSNPIPSRLARVIPGNVKPGTLGPPGADDVFVTAADDIAGLNAAQIAERLTIAPSRSFTVIEFNTPAAGLASPVLRTNPGFVGGGRTLGGAREFVIPNGPIPADAIIRTVGP